MLGFAWYDSEEELAKQLEVWDAAENPSHEWEGYQAYRTGMEQRYRNHLSKGAYTVVKVPIVVDELVEFSRKNGYKVDTDARVQYIGQKLESRFS